MSLQYKLYSNSILNPSIIVSPITDLTITDLRLYERTYRNLIKFIISGSPVSLIIFTSTLSNECRADVRKHFCVKAKQDRMNYVYFPFLCTVYTDSFTVLDPTDVVSL